MRDVATHERLEAGSPDGRLPLHAVLDAFHAWVRRPSARQRVELRTAFERLVSANGIAGAYLDVEASPLPPLALGAGSLRRRPAARRRDLQAVELRGDAGRVRLGRLVVDPDAEREDPGRRRGAEQAIRAIELALDATWARAEAHRAATRLVALDAATRAIAGVLDLDTVLQLIVDRVRDLVEAEYAALGIVDQEGQIDRFITSGISEAERERIGDPPSGRGLLGLIVRERRSLLVPDIAADPRHHGFPPHHPPMHSFIGVPVLVRGSSVGNLYLTNRRGGVAFTTTDLELVEAFSRHAGIAIESARLHERIGQLAIVEERERIGRDLHDGIIQGIYAVALSLEEAAESVESEPDESRARIDRAIESLNLSIRDIRNFIFGLRPELLEQAGLVGGLAALADEFRLNTMVDIELEAAGVHELELPESKTLELLSIAREALSNVARHARASRATIHAHRIPEGIRLVVADNGVGFAAGRRFGPSHQGLRNMRERAAGLGGIIDIQSEARRGTRIIVIVPHVETADPGTTRMEEADA